MNEKFVSQAAVAATAFAGLTLLTWWMLYNPVKDLVEKIPGRDNRPKGMVEMVVKVNIGALYSSFDGIPSADSASWPRFRGSEIDNINKEKIRLIDQWGKEGPKVLWSVDLGEGHAGPVISNGRVLLLDHDEKTRADMLRCFSFEDGREIWRRGYTLYLKRNHGISRTVPALTDRYVVTIGPRCHVMCVDAGSGDFKWGLDLEKDYGVETPLWYTGQCPLIDKDTVVIAVGGKALMIGLDLESGKVRWEAPNPMNWKQSHSSILPIVIGGKKLYVYCANGGIVAVSAEGETTGKIVLESALWNHNVIAPSPVHLGDGRILLTAGYGGGSMMVKISLDHGIFSLQSLQRLKPEEGLASEQQTPIYYKGYLYSILPKDAGPRRNEFVCCHPDDCGRFVWTSGTTNRFGLGPYIVADDKFFVLSDDGILTVLKASSKEYLPLAQAKILEGTDAWGPLAIAGGRLLARDSKRMVCLDLRAGS